MIDRIQAMRTFVRIVDTNSFTKAAQSLDMPRASATTILQNLEALLGTQLLVRTTRRLSLTPEGAAAIASQAKKRVVVRFHPEKWASWDHSKL